MNALLHTECYTHIARLYLTLLYPPASGGRQERVMNALLQTECYTHIAPLGLNERRHRLPFRFLSCESLNPVNPDSDNERGIKGVKG